MNRIRTALPQLVVALLGVAVVGGCSSSSGSATPVPSKVLPATATAWDVTTATLDGAGRLTLSAALTAFALAVGPVPGAVPATGPTGPIESASLAVASIRSHWDELSDVQRTAVRTALGVPNDHNAPAAYHESPTKPTDPELPCQSADSAGAEPYRAEAAGILGDVTTRLGRSLRIADRLFFTINSKNLEGPAWMYTYACHGGSAGSGSDSVDGCTIHLNPRAIGGTYTPAELRAFLVHEIVHCFLFDRFGLAYDAMPAWYVEGAPTWAMSDIGPANSRLGGIWAQYLDAPNRALSARSYDGLGFFVHLAESGAQVWKLIDPIGAALLGHATAQGWAAAAPSAAFLSSWGSGFVQARYPGPAWTSTGPNLPPYQPGLPAGRLGDGQTLTITAPAYAAAVRRIDVDAELVTITAGAGTTGRISIGGGQDAALTGGPFCTKGTCACPSGGQKFAPMASGDTFLGASAGSQPTNVVLTGSTLADACAKPTTSCLVGKWTATGFAVSAGTLTETGGAGVKMTIAATGAATVVFNGMKPVRFTGQASGTVLFRGSTSGAIRLPAPGVTEGTWQTTKAGGIDGITADVSVSAPAKLSLPGLAVGQMARTLGGLSAPQLTTGTWRCNADTLVSIAPAGGTVTGTWTLTREH